MKFPTFLFLSIAFAIAPLAHGDETPYVVSAEDARYACVCLLYTSPSPRD